MQDEWRVRTGPDHQRRDCATTCNSSTRSRPTANNVSPRVGVAWAPVASQRRLIRANVGRFYDRIPLRAVANALLSANNTTDLSRLRQIERQPVAEQTGAPVFPNILSAARADRRRWSTDDDGPRYSERAIRSGKRRDRASARAAEPISVGYDYLRGRQLIMQVNQNVPTCAALRAATTAAGPILRLREQQPVLVRGPVGLRRRCTVSFVQRPTKWGSSASRTRIRSR